MTILDNPKHERFAQLVARGKSQTSAYIEAGYSNNGANANASRLIAIDSVSQRIKDIQKSLIVQNDENKAQIMWEINNLIQSAIRIGQYQAAVKAMALKMRLLDLL